MTSAPPRRSLRVRLGFSALFVACTCASPMALAQLAKKPADAGVPDAAKSASAPTSALVQALDAQAPESVHGCVQNLAKGAARPVISEELPHRGTSGWISTLTLTIRHGRGEHVLPNGLELQHGGEAEKELRTAGFAFPEQDGGTGSARVTVLPEDKDHPEIVTTVLEIPVVLLPEKPGRNALVLPPLPVAIARANGDLSTVCTHAHSITVEDPIANEPEAEPRPNPPPRVQREEWREAKLFAIVVTSALVLGVLFGLLFRHWKNRPRPVPPPPPPRPAWEVALERLHEVRHAGLLDTNRKGEFCDRVSDALREYVGTTLGFDGLERTTDEITEELRKSTMADVERTRVLDVLRECDLVKFAKYMPETSACAGMLDAAEAHVRRTMPRSSSKAGAKREVDAKELATELLTSERSDEPASHPKDRVDVTKAQPEESATAASSTESKAESDTSAPDAGSKKEAESTTKDDEEPS
jgi:hypothetical protein